MPTKEELQSKLETLKTKLDEREFKYYFINGIENFIFHLDNFQNLRTKEKITTQIEDYLTLAIGKVGEEEKVFEKSKKLAPFIYNIAYVYKLEQGFIKEPDLMITFLLLVIFFFLLILVLPKFNALLICSSLFIIYFIRGYLKTKSKRVF